jgi:hypothetical protein
MVSVIAHNGPAIKGGCVTWRSIRAGSWYPPAGGAECCPGARQVWCAFCRYVTNFIEHWRGRGTRLISGRVFIPIDEVGKRHWCSIAVQFISKAVFYHGTGFKLCAAERIRVHGWLPIPVSGSESCKKHDKQLTFIVRVMCSWFYWIVNSSVIKMSPSQILILS